MLARIPLELQMAGEVVEAKDWRGMIEDWNTVGLDGPRRDVNVLGVYQHGAYRGGRRGIPLRRLLGDCFLDALPQCRGFSGNSEPSRAA